VTFLSPQAPIRRTWPAIVAGSALVLAGALSIGGIHLFGAQFGFRFIPLLVLAIWPRKANTILSIIFVFFAGVFTDWAAGDVVGQQAFLFMLVWGFLRPELLNPTLSWSRSFLVWGGICCLAIFVTTLSGWFVYGIMPDFLAFGRQLVLATMLLPVVLIVRLILEKRYSDGEDWGI